MTASIAAAFKPIYLHGAPQEHSGCGHSLLAFLWPIIKPQHHSSTLPEALWPGKKSFLQPSQRRPLKSTLHRFPVLGWRRLRFRRLRLRTPPSLLHRSPAASARNIRVPHPTRNPQLHAPHYSDASKIHPRQLHRCDCHVGNLSRVGRDTAGSTADAADVGVGFVELAGAVEVDGEGSVEVCEGWRDGMGCGGE